MSARVKFERPPVVEVVCGVQFSTKVPLIAAHVGAFWQSIRKDFPRAEQVDPLMAVIEQPISSLLGGVEQSPMFLESAQVRTWLLAEDGRALIQIQNDRFLYNWKRAEDDDTYPSYDAVIAKFEEYLAAFLKFLDAEKIGQPEYRQFELTYVNIIPPEGGLDLVGNSAMLVDHIRDNAPGRFLPEPEMFKWNTSYLMPNDYGRLHIVAMPAYRRTDQARVFKLELTARGIPSSDPNMRAWFDVAHEWITSGFADATSPKVQKEIWRRTQ